MRTHINHSLLTTQSDAQHLINTNKWQAEEHLSFWLFSLSHSFSLAACMQHIGLILALECAQQTNDSAACYWQTRHLAFVLCLGSKEAVPLPRIFAQRGQCWFLINFQLGVLPFNCADEKKQRICCWLSFVPRASGRRAGDLFPYARKAQSASPTHNSCGGGLSASLIKNREGPVAH